MTFYEYTVFTFVVKKLIFREVTIKTIYYPTATKYRPNKERSQYK